MDFLQKMERKYGKYAIRRLTTYIIMTYVAGYILSMMQSLGRGGSANIMGLLALSPSLILKGQIWRLVSWLLIPPSSFGFFTVIMLFVYYQLGTLLERTWGDFLYNVYIFSGLIMTVIGAFVLYLATGVDFGSKFTTYYVSLSIFLGFAMTFPDMQMLFMFIIPIKVKYLAIVDIIYLVYEIVTYFRYGGVAYGLPVLVMILSSLAGTILFFFLTRRNSRFGHRERKRQRDFRNAMNGAGSGWTDSRNTGSRGAGFGGGPANRNSTYEKVDRHTFGGERRAVHHCAVCGRTELDDPDLEFRFCSKCNGNYEYCQDHLYTHIHVQ